MFVEREILSEIKKSLEFYPIVSLTGPRQSGKSTLLRNSFPNWTYVNLEDKKIRDFVKNDPEEFLDKYPQNTIIDEAQYCPDLFSYLQVYTDNENQNGMYILSGSQNFLLSKQISQSLAGRVGILRLLPYSLTEIHNSKLDEEFLKGSYPRLFNTTISSKRFYSDYVETYLQRDVRELNNVRNISTFKNFLNIIARRVGRELNLTTISSLTGVTVPTIKEWLSILEASYIVYFSLPFLNVLDKRITKTSKLYFYDTGLAFSLANLGKIDNIPRKELGLFFENYIYSEFAKQHFNKGEIFNPHFWKESRKKKDGEETGSEVDLILEGEKSLYEIKMNSTLNYDFGKGMNKFNTASNLNFEKNIIYRGENFKTKVGNFINYKDYFLGNE